jgi:hypothetical protein
VNKNAIGKKPYQGKEKSEEIQCRVAYKLILNPERSEGSHHPTFAVRFFAALRI